MTIDYRIEHENRLIVSTATGLVTEADLLEHIIRITAIRQTMDFDHLADMRLVKEIEQTNYDFVRRLINIASSADKPDSAARLAIVASSTSVIAPALVYKVCRNTNKGATVRTAVFKSLDAALSFLGRRHMN